MMVSEIDVLATEGAKNAQTLDTITYQWQAYTARGVALAAGTMELAFPEKGESRWKPVLAGGPLGTY